MLNNHEIEIINCLVEGWVRDEARIPGGVCYQDVFDLLEKLGAEQPTELIDYIASIDIEKAIEENERPNPNKKLIKGDYPLT